MIPRLNEEQWRALIDHEVLPRMVEVAERHQGVGSAVFLTGSYARGVINIDGPNVNVYFIASRGAEVDLRGDLAASFSSLRASCRAAGAELLIDCHPFTISNESEDWLDAPTITVTTKVFAADRANSTDRLGLSPTIGYGWHATHRVLLGKEDALDFLRTPPSRDDRWFAGAGAALTAYRNILDHLPWALDPGARPASFFREVVRYAEETIKDGVHFGATDDEVSSGRVLEVLHDWNSKAPSHFAERYGTAGENAVRVVAEMKERLPDRHSVRTEEAMEAWRDAINVWEVVWHRFTEISEEAGAPAVSRRLLTWM